LLRLFRFATKLVMLLAVLALALTTMGLVVVALRYWIWRPDPLTGLFGDRMVINLGHRGAPEVAPENTLPSFLAALEQGAQGVELDVMLSKDGEIMVIHDPHLEKTTTGSGLVSEYTLAELKQLDAGALFGEPFIGTTIPTLQEVIDSLPSTALINIEIKGQRIFTDGLERAVVNVVAEKGLLDRVIVSSFNPVSLLRVKWADSRIPIALLYSPDLPVYLSEGWLIPVIRPEVLHPRYDMVDEAYMKWARNKGYRVNVWTVNEAAEIKRLLDLRVDGIITDRPDLLHQILQERGLNIERPEQ